MESIAAQVKLGELICHQMGEGKESVRPYLWTVFFRIDGQGVELTEQFELVGEADFHFTKGSHGNLGKTQMQAGERWEIPPVVGHWNGKLSPITVPFFSYELPGIIGCISILMSQGRVSEAGAEAGHTALNQYAKEAVNRSIHQFDVRKLDVENILESVRIYVREQAESLAPEIEKAVPKAIMRSQNLWQNFLSLLDRDQLLGYAIWEWHQKEWLTDTAGTSRSLRWQTEAGDDWELTAWSGPVEE